MRKKYNDETLEKVFYYYSLAGNRMLTAAQAADCLNLSESSLFRVIADFRETISREKEEELIQKYQNVDVHSVLNIKETPKNHSNEKSILEDIAITLAEILASINELKQYVIEKENSTLLKKENKEETWKSLEKIQKTEWEDLEKIEEFISKGEEIKEIEEKAEEDKIEEDKTEEKTNKTTWKGEAEPTLEELEKGLANLEEQKEETTKKELKTEQETKLKTEKKDIPVEQKEEDKKLNSVEIMCITQLNYMCKEINDLVSYKSMERMWNDWEKICRGYGSRINPIYQRIWHQIKKKTKKEITEDTIRVICDAQVEQMELELQKTSSQEAITNISYTYYNWIRQVFEMCYLVQEPISQERTKVLYANYLTKLKNISNHKLEQIQ